MRVLPNGLGSEFLSTLFLPAEAAASAVAERWDVLAQELQLLKALCEPS